MDSNKFAAELLKIVKSLTASYDLAFPDLTTKMKYLRNGRGMGEANKYEVVDPSQFDDKELQDVIDDHGSRIWELDEKPNKNEESPKDHQKRITDMRIHQEVIKLYQAELHDRETSGSSYGK